MVGITAFGAYLPRMRLQKQVIADANAWFDPGLKGLAKGEKAICNWDEDTITMAVEAYQDCLGNAPGQAPAALLLASTTLPFADRQNSVVVAEALNLDTSDLRTMDITCSQRAATSGLLSALDIAAAGKEAVLVASEHRKAKCASREEMLYGDGAAAIAVGSENVIAELVASQSQAVDFIDHYRGEGQDFDYGWEERWVRDEGYMKIVPDAVNALLSKASVSAGDIAHFVLPTDQGRVPPMVAKKLGIKAEAVADNLLQSVGITGAAHVMLLLAHRLEQAVAGDLVLVAGFGQGCDVLLFKVTDAIAGKQAAGKGVSGHLSNGRPETNYNKYQSFNNLLEKELGKRSEVNKQGYLSAMYRARGLTNSFLGGKCTACDTVQMPKHKYCVNPECGAFDTQVDHPMAGAMGTIATWTADTLTFDYNPPAYFGMVTFEEGGRIMMDMSEVDAETFDTGSQVALHFRLKQIDDQAGFRKYFWKAIQV
ncbi:hypothetical protein A9Q89_10265 [Gammaproteobacteria bacterium 53_120_T64]|nr:hypothetical protein A9Q89_10265 [Gammaproteobacteria bacterium 53_120_T64]